MKTLIKAGVLSAALLTGFNTGFNASLAQERASDSASDTKPVAAEPVQKTPIDAESKKLIDTIWPTYVFISGGSGVCISEDGYVLTNHHVEPSATTKYSRDGKTRRYKVRMPGRKKALQARPVAADPRGDIVLLKIDVPEGEKLPFSPLADSSKVKVGDVTIAIGNPFLLGNESNDPSISQGVVSALGRMQSGYTDCIQVDSAVNPGNSGGPSFNLKGEVIGINGRIFTTHGNRYNTGIGFAISANQIKRFLPTFKAQPGGALLIRHGLIAGLQLDHDDAAVVSASMRDFMRGPRISDIRKGSDADRAGFEVGDKIIKVGGEAVANCSQFYSKLQTWPQGAMVAITVQRGDKEIEIKVPLNVPVVLNQSADWPWAADGTLYRGGLVEDHLLENEFIFKNLDAAERRSGAKGSGPFGSGTKIVIVGLQAPFPNYSSDPAKIGIEITAIAEGSSAEGILKVGETITHMGSRRIRYLSDLHDCLKGYRNGESVDFTVLTAAGKKRNPQRDLQVAGHHNHSSPIHQQSARHKPCALLIVSLSGAALLLDFVTRDRQALNLAGAFHQLHQARRAEELFNAVFFHVAVAAKHLNRVGADLRRHF